MRQSKSSFSLKNVCTTRIIYTFNTKFVSGWFYVSYLVLRGVAVPL